MSKITTVTHLNIYEDLSAQNFYYVVFPTVKRYWGRIRMNDGMLPGSVRNRQCHFLIILVNLCQK
jgi:hypothetical protein